MENCTIYSHKLEFEKVVEIVRSNLPKAKVEFDDQEKQKSLVATIKGGFFGKSKTLKINYRERINPSYKLDSVDGPLAQNLAGMTNYIQSLPAKNETVRNKFLHKVMAANCEMPFMATPEINEEFGLVLEQIVKELNGFIFAQPNSFFVKSNSQHFVDKNFDLILDAEGNCEISDIDVTVDAKYHDLPAEDYTEEQLARKQRSESFLSDHEIKTNTNLPCLASENDVKLREVGDVIDRAYALLIVAVKGEGVEQEHLQRTVQEKNISSFTPKEQHIYKTKTLSDQERANAAWRYESLYTLLWALGKTEDLKYPSDICDVQMVVGQFLKPTRAEFTSSVEMKTAKDILDELDKTFRIHWACVDARINGQETTGGINSSVIYERHYALNWLTKYQDQAWDDVQTNT